MAVHNCFRASTSLLLTVLLSSTAAAVEAGPQTVVRQFCQLDGMGRRVSIPGWTDVAPLVSWSFEPAWDHVVLISGYSVGAPRPGDEGTVTVDVSYNTVDQVSALGIETLVRVETEHFEVRAVADSGWRISGPPLPPHIFTDPVDVESMRRSLEQGGLNFLPNTLFVWRMFHTAGWNVPFQRTIDLLGSSAYRAVARPAVGDVVVYLRNGAPYHVGLLETEHQVVSSTLNGGIVRTPIQAFAGEVKYLRLVQPDPLPTPEPPTPTRVVNTATPPHVRTPAPHPPMQKKEPQATRQHAATLPSPRRMRTKKAGSVQKHATPHPTAAPTREPH
jgi:hypothetical protein